MGNHETDMANNFACRPDRNPGGRFTDAVPISHRGRIAPRRSAIGLKVPGLR